MKLDHAPTRDALAAEYVLGTLTGAARARFEKYLRTSQPLREAVAYWERRLDGLANAVEPAEVPERLWNSLTVKLGFARATTGAAWGLRAWVAAALVAGIALGGLWQPLRQQLMFHADVKVAFEDEAQHQMKWRVEADFEKNALRVYGISDVAVANDKSYELWLLRGPGEAPVSLGLMPVDRGVVREYPAPLALKTGSGFAVSVEPRGGSPTHLPTGPVIHVAKFAV
jgi:anti-sigma-K factor RskA